VSLLSWANSNEGGRTILHKVCEIGSLLLFQIIVKQVESNQLKKQFVELLATKDRAGWTPLHYAASKNHAELVSSILNESEELAAITDLVLAPSFPKVGLLTDVVLFVGWKDSFLLGLSCRPYYMCPVSFERLPPGRHCLICCNLKGTYHFDL